MGKDNHRRHGAGRAGSVAEPDVDGEESVVSDLAPDAAEREIQQLPPSGGGKPPVKTTKGFGGTGGGFGKIYKPGQGYHIRVGTAIGSAVLIVAGAAYLYEQLGNLMTPGTAYYWPVRYGVSVAFLIVMSVLTYWLVGVNRRANDFFIATEGEMKKVNWSTRREVIRSTKVVIVTVVLMATLLFVVDVLFMMFFSSIEVLQASPGLKRLFGAGE